MLTVGTSSLTYRMLHTMSRLQTDMDTTMTQLTTGKRINSAKDDPRSMVALSRMNSDLVATQAALENNQRSQSVLDSADGVLAQVSDLSAEIESLVVSANDPEASEADKAAYQNQLDNAIDQIDELIAKASYGGRKLFVGETEMAGADSGNGNISDVHVYNGDSSVMNGTTDETWTVDSSTNDAITVAGNSAVTEIIKEDDGSDSDFRKVYYNDGDWSVSFLIDISGGGAANDEVTITAGTGADFQLGVDASTRATLDMGAGMLSSELGKGVLTEDGSAFAGALDSLKTGGANELTAANSRAAEVAKEASAHVAGLRARLGSFNKFQVGTSLKALESVQENLTGQISRIEDTDYAAASSELDRQNVMMNTMITLMSAANSQQSNILALLRS